MGRLWDLRKFPEELESSTLRFSGQHISSHIGADSYSDIGVAPGSSNQTLRYPGRYSLGW